MGKRRISKSTVDATHSAAKDLFVWDDKLTGFGLKVTPSGSKVYLYQYRLGGRGAKVRRYTIGRHGTLTPDGARTIAEGLALKVASGVDPQRVKVEQARQAIDLAFDAYVDTFADDCLKVKWKASHEYAKSLLVTYAIPVLRNKPLPQITAKDIRAVIAPVKSKLATAHNLFSVIRRLFRWAVNEGDLEISPIDGMEPPAAPATRDVVLTDDELAVVWRAAGDLGYPFGPMVRILILTGARREEVAGLEWPELSHNALQWSLPASRAKNDTAASWPLSSLAVAELDALAKRSGKATGWPRKGFVFSTTGETSVSGFSRSKTRLDKLVIKEVAKLKEPVSVQTWRLHDLRRTLATGMQRLGVRFEVTEAILNHVSGSRSGVAGIYQRHDWGPEKKVALQSWADHITSVLTSADKSNVVQLASVRA
ncbi:MAG: integrase arm-type DNA-binding domain-containing protein [Novosphingobium sp.]|nr:integrase arm-type DNA-binding domain-containing protein [Novosphingobium sp.]